MDWVFQNLYSGIKYYNLWIRLAITDIQLTYKRSLFGMTWVALSFALFIAAKIIIFGSIAGVDGPYFSIWLATGFWVWTLIFTSVIDGCNCLITSRGWILGTKLPLSVYIYQTSIRVLIRFLFILPIIVLLLIYYRWTPQIGWLWIIPSFIIFILNGLWVQLFLGSLCVKYRDISHLMLATMQVMFFVTPILYMPQQLGDKAYLLDYNPFTHYIAIMREPIINNTLPILSWQIVGIITLLGWCIALYTFKRMGRQVPFIV